MRWLFATFGVGFASALVPVVNIEAYLVGVVVARHPPAWPLALLAAAGQMAGKMIFWAVGAGLLSFERVSRKGTAKGRWARRMEALQVWCDRHRWGPVAVTFASGVTGLPPFAVWSVLAGTIRMPWPIFLLVGLAGRTLRFGLVVVAPGLLPGHH